jgi:hypothetical protein
MDGFAVGHLVQGVQYHLSERLAHYLIVAGYAVAEPRNCDPPHDSAITHNRQRRADD